jgi:acyl carrier protein
MDAIAEKVKKVIADTLGANESALTPETDLYKDLGADSLDVVELIVNLEREFGVTIPDEKIERMTRVRNFIEHFEKVKPIPEAFYAQSKAA